MRKNCRDFVLIAMPECEKTATIALRGKHEIEKDNI